MAHDPKSWHPWYPGDENTPAHHHGNDPADYLSVFGEPLAAFLEAGYFLAPPWSTGTPENPEEHAGYICLHTGNELTEIQEGKNAIHEALLFIHATGTISHFTKRFHSHYCFARMIGNGVIGTGGWGDSGNAQLQYKKSFLTLPTNPGGDLNQQPYHSQQPRPSLVNGEIVQFQFWSIQAPNLIAEQYFSPISNHILGTGWETVDAPEYLGSDNVTDVRYGPGQNRRFQIFNIQLQNLPTSRPFNGFTTRHGYQTTLPGPVGVDKVPFTITANVPQGDASLYRRVGHGKKEYAPILEF
jgi:hypothetical protein